MFQRISKLFEPIKVYKDRKSQTVPDMSYTPREIIAKFSRGERVPLGFDGAYDSLDDDPSMDPYYDDPAIFEDDPTRDPEFDFGDYVEEMHALKERNDEKKRRSKSKHLSDEKRKANSEELSASDATKKETTSGSSESASSAQE